MVANNKKKLVDFGRRSNVESANVYQTQLEANRDATYRAETEGTQNLDFSTGWEQLGEAGSYIGSIASAFARVDEARDLEEAGLTGYMTPDIANDLYYTDKLWTEPVKAADAFVAHQQYIGKNRTDTIINAAKTGALQTGALVLGGLGGYMMNNKIEMLATLGIGSLVSTGMQGTRLGMSILGNVANPAKLSLAAKLGQMARFGAVEALANLAVDAPIELAAWALNNNQDATGVQYTGEDFRYALGASTLLGGLMGAVTGPKQYLSGLNDAGNASNNIKNTHPVDYDLKLSTENVGTTRSADGTQHLSDSHVKTTIVTEGTKQGFIAAPTQGRNNLVYTKSTGTFGSGGYSSRSGSAISEAIYAGSPHITTHVISPNAKGILASAPLTADMVQAIKNSLSQIPEHIDIARVAELAEAGENKSLKTILDAPEVANNSAIKTKIGEALDSATPDDVSGVYTKADDGSVDLDVFPGRDAATLSDETIGEVVLDKAKVANVVKESLVDAEPKHIIEVEEPEGMIQSKDPEIVADAEKAVSEDFRAEYAKETDKDIKELLEEMDSLEDGSNIRFSKDEIDAEVGEERLLDTEAVASMANAEAKLAHEERTLGFMFHGGTAPSITEVNNVKYNKTAYTDRYFSTGLYLSSSMASSQMYRRSAREGGEAFMHVVHLKENAKLHVLSDTMDETVLINGRHADQHLADSVVSFGERHGVAPQIEKALEKLDIEGKPSKVRWAKTRKAIKEVVKENAGKLDEAQFIVKGGTAVSPEAKAMADVFEIFNIKMKGNGVDGMEIRSSGTRSEVGGSKPIEVVLFQTVDSVDVVDKLNVVPKELKLAALENMRQMIAYAKEASPDKINKVFKEITTCMGL